METREHLNKAGPAQPRTYRLSCTCLVNRQTEHLIACCALHEREWQTAHAASVAERAANRADEVA